jgi:uncharacterized protein YfaS (alpha-2-macroglobulin family)
VIVGDVRDETTGLGVPQAFVQFVDRHGQTRFSAVTDGDGNFELSGLPAGQFQSQIFVNHCYRPLQEKRATV